MGISIGIACVACVIAVVYDVRWRRIPNWVTLPLIVCAPLLALLRGLGAFEQACLLLVGLFVGGLLLHRTGWLGGGDIKLAVGIGTLLLYPRVVVFLFGTALAGGIVAVAMAIAQGRGASIGLQLRTAFLGMIGGGSQVVAPVEATPADERVPYAIAIAVGLVTAMLFSLFDPARFAS